MIFSEKFFGESQYKLSNFLQDHPERQVQLTSLKNGGKGLAWFLIFTTQVLKKKNLITPLRLLEGSYQCLWFEKKFQN